MRWGTHLRPKAVRFGIPPPSFFAVTTHLEKFQQYIWNIQDRQTDKKTVFLAANKAASRGRWKGPLEYFKTFQHISICGWTFQFCSPIPFKIFLKFHAAMHKFCACLYQSLLDPSQIGSKLQNCHTSILSQSYLYSSKSSALCCFITSIYMKTFML